MIERNEAVEVTRRGEPMCAGDRDAVQGGDCLENDRLDELGDRVLRQLWVLREDFLKPVGMGEPPVPVAVAAVVNALSSASSRRLRRLPILTQDLKGA